MQKFFKILSLLAISIAASLANPAFAKSSLKNGVMFPYQAPEIAGIEKWFNGNPIKLSNLKGKVILIEFWTYSCINCIRGLPHINEFYEKYSNKGLNIIGIHTPEFDYEKDPKNVTTAIRKYNIKYPVGLDNEEQTWDNYENKYWPAYYIINKEGKVVYTHFGEGNYDLLENNIRHLINS